MIEDSARWKATIKYRIENGEETVTHMLEELSDLHDCVEAGPHFDTVAGIEVIRVNHVTSDKLTVEAAEKL